MDWLSARQLYIAYIRGNKIKDRNGNKYIKIFTT